MISEHDKNAIIEMASSYGLKRVLLFGSSLDAEKESHDIDIAVEGISPKDFFQFYGELMFKVSKPIDVIDLSNSNTFTHIVKREGIELYANA